MSESTDAPTEDRAAEHPAPDIDEGPTSPETVSPDVVAPDMDRPDPIGIGPF